MTRNEMAHILRAAQAITNEREFVLVGSQAAHVGIARLPSAMQQSGELDIYPLRRPDLADLIDDSIGEGSTFHDAHGYHAQGVGPETAKLPHDWMKRTVRVSNAQTQGAVGIAPEIHDLCASKLVAGRVKDFDYVQAGINAELVDPRILAARLAEIDGLPHEVVARGRNWAMARAHGPGNTDRSR